MGEGPHIVGMQKLLPVVLAVAFTACGDLEVPGTGGPSGNNNGVGNGQPTCDGLDGDTFASVEDQPIDQRCQFDANNNYECVDLYGSWTVTFDQRDVFWDTYQFVAAGTFTCSAGQITASINGRTVEGTYSNGSLTWDGLRYRR